MKISSPITTVYPSPSRRISGMMRYALSAIGIIVLLFYLRQIKNVVKIKPSLTQQNEPKISQIVSGTRGPGARPKEMSHPIDELIKDADKKFEDLITRRSFDIKTAAAQYRKKRGRYPPPGFDQWFEFAKKKNAIIVEDFFDQIYQDLNPFWGLSPAIMRKKAASYEMTINIRNHKASAGSDWFWTQTWLDLIQTIQHLLPDMDIALNAMDEPRIVVPWEDMNKYKKAELKTRKMWPVKDIITSFSSLDTPFRQDQDLFRWESETNGSFWEIVTRGCHPNSLARREPIMANFSHPPIIGLQYTTHHTYKGFVSNFTAASDFCNQPDLQALHGIMIKPLSISSTKEFFPMFGGSKLHTNNEILLPAPVYWSNEERFSGGTNHGGPWEDKIDQVIWRGVATGGRNQHDNWRGFHRHRFVAMTNGSKISAAENWHSIPENWALPMTQYNLAAQVENKLGEWTNKWADTGFVDLNCDPYDNRTCYYSAPHFQVAPGMMMSDQFHRKYLPDIDGNSFSGRYRGFLLSTSLPIKATVFREWHDNRLVPWKHFVPMDTRFIDFWGIMQYFLGYEGANVKILGHDEYAKKIALEGQEWANRVLRTEDMQIYVLRLLLEYARVSDDRREKMGWVEDLLQHSKSD